MFWLTSPDSRSFVKSTGMRRSPRISVARARSATTGCWPVLVPVGQAARSREHVEHLGGTCEDELARAPHRAHHEDAGGLRGLNQHCDRRPLQVGGQLARQTLARLFGLEAGDADVAQHRDADASVGSYQNAAPGDLGVADDHDLEDVRPRR